MRTVIITIKYIFAFLAVITFITPIWYNFNNDYITHMQIIKKFWYMHIGFIFSIIGYLFLKTMENDY